MAGVKFASAVDFARYSVSFSFEASGNRPCYHFHYALRVQSHPLLDFAGGMDVEVEGFAHTLFTTRFDDIACGCRYKSPEACEGAVVASPQRGLKSTSFLSLKTEEEDTMKRWPRGCVRRSSGSAV